MGFQLEEIIRKWSAKLRGGPGVRLHPSIPRIFFVLIKRTRWVGDELIKQDDAEDARCVHRTYVAQTAIKQQTDRGRLLSSDVFSRAMAVTSNNNYTSDHNRFAQPPVFLITVHVIRTHELLTLNFLTSNPSTPRR